MRFYGVIDDDEAVELFVRREDAERFLEDVRADDEEPVRKCLRVLLRDGRCSHRGNPSNVSVTVDP